jgi:hypothetical protein
MGQRIIDLEDRSLDSYVLPADKFMKRIVNSDKYWMYLFRV